MLKINCLEFLEGRQIITNKRKNTFFINHEVSAAVNRFIVKA